MSIENRDFLLFFVFQRRGASDPTTPNFPAAPLKNKKKALGLGVPINISPLRGLARHQQISCRMCGRAVAPDRPHLGEPSQEANRCLHRVHKPQGRAGIGLAEIQGARGEVRLKPPALEDRAHPRLREARAMLRRMRSASAGVHAVEGPSKPFSTSRCNHSMRCCLSSFASSNRSPSRTTSVAEP